VLCALALFYLERDTVIQALSGDPDGAQPAPQRTAVPEEVTPESGETGSPEASLPPAPALLPDITRAQRPVTLADGTRTTFAVAEPFDIAVAAEGLGKARFMTRSPDGRIFVPDLVDYNLSREGRILILEDFDPEARVFQKQHTYRAGLRGPNSVAFYTDDTGQQWIYIALTAELIRYPYKAGDTRPQGEPEVIATFPNDQVPGQKSVVWHITRTIEFRGDRLFVSVGSGCNSCEQPTGELRGMIYSLAPDGSDKVVYARGLRNAVGFEWATLPGSSEASLFATENGDDHLGVSAPDDVLYQLTEGEHYGWPYCYESDGAVLPDTSKSWEEPIPCAEVPTSFTAFAPHTAPLGMTYFDEAHPVLENSFLVALHGSFDQNVKNGYRIVRVSPTGEQAPFIDGFQAADGTRLARPVDILQHDEDSFFFTDDHTGRVYFVYAR